MGVAKQHGLVVSVSERTRATGIDGIRNTAVHNTIFEYLKFEICFYDLAAARGRAIHSLRQLLDVSQQCSRS